MNRLETQGARSKEGYNHRNKGYLKGDIDLGRPIQNCHLSRKEMVEYWQFYLAHLLNAQEGRTAVGTDWEGRAALQVWLR